MNEETESLSAAEQAYFDSKGESELPPAEQVPSSADDLSNGDDAIIEEEAQAAVEEPEKPKTVPHAALHAEREEHKKTRAQMQTMQSEIDQYKGKLDIILQSMAQPQTEPQQEVIPDPDQDFIGYVRWQTEQINKQKHEIEQEKHQQQQMQMQQQNELALHQFVGQSHDEFIKEKPDAGEAIEYLSQYRDRQLQFMGKYDPRYTDPNFRAMQMEQEVREVIQMAASTGQNPVAMLYDFASNNGYKPKAIQAADKLQSVAGAQASARTLAASSGGAVGNINSADELAKMSEDEFADWYDKNKGKFKKIMGG